MLASLVSILLLAKLFQLSHEEYVTLLPKSITTAIGMGVSEELGGIVTITVCSNYHYRSFGKYDRRHCMQTVFVSRNQWQRGLHLEPPPMAIGTAKAMELGEVEGAMSSLGNRSGRTFNCGGCVCICQFYVR